MRVLVTGGAGFIGTAVARRLREVGHEPVIFDRAIDRRDDIVDVARLRRTLPGCGAVIHLAAKVGLGVDLSDLTDYARDNDLGTAAVLRATAEEGIGRLVLASSMVVYGEGRGECPDHGIVRGALRSEADLAAGHFESRCPHCARDLAPRTVSEAAELDPRNSYAATKVQLEQFAAIWARETGGVAVSLRYHNVYGPGLPRDTPYAGVAAIFRSALLSGRAPTVYEDGAQRRDLVHVDDVAAATIAALTADLPRGRNTALNIGSGVVTTIAEVAQAMATLLGGRPPLITAGYRLGDVRHITADSSAARRLLGWRPRIGLTAGLADLLAETPIGSGARLRPSPGSG